MTGPLICRRIALLALLVLFAPAAAALDWPNRVRGPEQRYEEGNVEQRVEAIEDLAALDAVEVVDLLRRALDDRSADVRAAAVAVAGAVHADALSDELIEALSDRSADVRASACGALAALRDPSLADPLSRSLADRDGDVRVAAIDALASLGDPDAVIAIVGTLHDSDRDVVAAALEALGRLGQPWTLYPILEKVHDPVQEVAVAAIGAVASLRATEALPALVELVQTGRPEVIVAAVDALGEIGSREATSALVSQVVAPTAAGATAAAIDALARIADPRSVELLAPHVVRHDTALHPVFAATAPASWSVLRSAWLAASDADVKLAALRAWLASGDPAAVDATLATERPLHQQFDLLTLSSAPASFCRRAALAPLDAATIAGDAVWALHADAVDCLDAALARDGVVVDDPELVVFLAGAGSRVALELARGIDTDSLGAPTVAALTQVLIDADGGSELLAQMLASDDASVRREAALALAERDDTWLDATSLASMLDAASRRPEVLVALVGQLDGVVGDRIVAAARHLALDGTADVRAEALLLLSLRCDAASAGVASAAVDSDDLWLRRAGARLAAGCGFDEVLAAAYDMPDRVVRSLATSQLEPALLALRIADRNRSTDERVAALDALCVEANQLCLEMAAQHLHSRDAALAAGAWLALSRHGELPATADMLLTAAATRRAVERGAILLAIVDELDAGDRDAVLRRERHPALQRIVRDGRDAFGDQLTLAFVDDASGVPRADEPVFVMWDDGRFAVVRSDRLGRVVLRGRDVALAMHVAADDATPYWSLR